MPSCTVYQDLSPALSPWGLVPRGGFYSEGPQTHILIGNVGSAMWRSFLAENIDAPDPLDRWTRQVVEPIAEQFNAQALYAFEGPPYHPFQRWAMKAEAVFPSPIGPLIHPKFGLWHAYRAALMFDRMIDLPIQEPAASPCEACAEKPCLSACPVEAFSTGRYDVPACVEHLETPEGASCLNESCAARRACPVRAQHCYTPEQSKHHMTAFLRAQTSQSKS
ncbi:MAG: hypothetical protein HOB79_08845 [Rhodospirillaceae bacterium]|mgnify:FL=1|nr:hypothetical protein [Rhodospirillales bacterium]MBT3905466.1 hypothetical protein [Rhodospirillaceae bacterium]MBT4701174.1 hypothetical protein [Rhodospirillaceae bacterium]MBT5034178.1 hypothetical protein [Rhodospirillaceae bacterium]MBT6220010.1 hypothetical protein [Rhodospirillaceae bacterium]